MAMSDQVRRYTAQMVRELPEDGNRYEVVHGELLVTPAPLPKHQAVVQRLHLILHPYLESAGHKGWVFLGPADISWDDETLVQPDVLVVPRDEVTNDWSSYKTLLLAVEIVSPSSARIDRVIKRRLYQENRVATYWIVDPDAGLVEVWRPEDKRPEIVADTLRWRLEPGAPELTIDVRELLTDLPR